MKHPPRVLRACTVLLPAVTLVALLIASAAAQSAPLEQSARPAPGVPAASPAGDLPPPSRDVSAILADLVQLEASSPSASKPENGAGEAARQALQQRRAGLALELFRAQPSHPQLATLMPQRWHLLLVTDRARAEEEMAQVLRTQPSPELVAQAWYWRVQATVAGGDRAAIEAAVETFRRHDPSNMKGARMLMLLAAGAWHQPEHALALYREVLDDYPGFARARFIPGKVRRIEQRGAPFELAFDDLRTGRPVDVAAWRGRIVVVHFWRSDMATSRDELAELSALSAKAGPRGEVFVGVNLDACADDAGQQALRQRLVDWHVDWPQDCPGAGLDSPIALEWGLDDAPATFVLDREGHLADANAMGRVARVLGELLGDAPPVDPVAPR